MSEGVVSRYGVYRDLEKSPYRYESPYGDLFKFRSQKKLDIYTREIERELKQVNKFVCKFELDRYAPQEIIQLLYRLAYTGLYNRIEG